MRKIKQNIGYVFETSWEVCNKIGGIHTVVSTKAELLKDYANGNLVTIGPDINHYDVASIEFVEDDLLFLDWKQQLNLVGINVRIGYWNIPAKTQTILIESSKLNYRKDEILKELWDEFQLNSLTGQQDYIEAALFGYAAGMVIKNFTEFYLNKGDIAIAHFHEWMTGAGILYLKHNAPSITTVFTTHATVTGRSITGNNNKLYENIDKFNGDSIALQFGIAAKHSLEKIAAKEADSFTSVSEITAEECNYLLDKEPDTITPNGFTPSFVPSAIKLSANRKLARQLMIDVAESVTGNLIPKDTFITGTSGRYEYRSKGIDVYIEGLGILNKENNGKKILAFFFIPAQNYGPIPKDDKSNKYVTHYLHEPSSDTILNKLKAEGITNASGDRVQAVFVPAYLFGNDGVFNRTYYEILSGLDLSLFPSYYEPWGYTPLESLAFKIPTVNTTLCGLGSWLNKKYNGDKSGIQIIERNDENQELVSVKIADAIKKVENSTPKEYNEFQDSAAAMAKVLSWKELFCFYRDAYDKAIAKTSKRNALKVPVEGKLAAKQRSTTVDPNWREINVALNLPLELEPLLIIANNIWWTWSDDAKKMFNSMDPKLWEDVDHNPLELLNKIPYSELENLSRKPVFIKAMNEVTVKFENYLEERKNKKGPAIAYFSMEYGFHGSIPIYSGGLGILAGDYLKEASDRNVNLTGFGFLYRYGYFTQEISNEGTQNSIYVYHDFNSLPVNLVLDEYGNALTIGVDFPGRTVYFKVWKLKVGCNDLYLFDTDFSKNNEEDRSISHTLYGGDNEHRLKQEIILGIGGIKTIKELELNPDIYHLNEGHSAFIGIERLRSYMEDEHLSYSEAEELVRVSSLFTTHTPVPAGHDVFEESLIQKYFSEYPASLNLSWDSFLSLGRINQNRAGDKFNMSHLACHLCQEVNGVSMLHGEVSRDIFSELWQGYMPEELHIGYVTNGVHLPTWMSPIWKKTIKAKAKLKDDYELSLPESFEAINTLSDKEIWDIKHSLKTSLIQGIKEQLDSSMMVSYEDPKNIVKIKETLSDKVLTIGFARRFATYKRADLLFRNLDKLSTLLNNPDRPIQLLFAGKAHPSDGGGQDLIKKIVTISKMPEFLGKILFIENYNIQIAKKLVQGVDVWMNTPTRPLEASGTSGEKGVMNGTLHFSVLDGWWVEGYLNGAGWALPQERTYDDQNRQDQLDASTIYYILEHEIAPAYYNKDKKEYSKQWVEYVKKCLIEVAPKFTTKRMIEDYERLFYSKLANRTQIMRDNDYAKASELSEWKQKVMEDWDQIEVSQFRPDVDSNDLFAGEEYKGEIDLILPNLNADNFGIDVVVIDRENKIVAVSEANIKGAVDNIVTYRLSISLPSAGSFRIGLRLYPKHLLIPHKQDFPLVKWI